MDQTEYKYRSEDVSTPTGKSYGRTALQCRIGKLSKATKKRKERYLHGHTFFPRHLAAMYLYEKSGTIQYKFRVTRGGSNGATHGTGTIFEMKYLHLD